MKSLTNKRNRRNGDLGRGYESMESLTEKMGRELVVKEAKRLELEKKALEAEKKRKSVEAKYEASLQEQIRMQMKVTKQSIPGPDRGDETIQRKGRDTRNSNKLMEVNPNNIDLLVATTKKVLQNYEVEAERNKEMERLLAKLFFIHCGF